MMVMDNAGAVINELTLAGVRLVLHGHRHHQHFARIVMNPSKTPYAELAVLAAGTPTEGRNAGAFRHGFNLIEIDAAARIRIRPFEAPPEFGSFVAQPDFDMTPPEQHDRELYRACAATAPLTCRRLLCVAEINAYGDARYVREYRSLAARDAAVHEMPGPFVAEASRGLVEAYVAHSLSDHGPGVNVRTERASPHRIEAWIGFTNGLQAGDGPVDLGSEFHATNAFALNAWQFVAMYRDRNDLTEHLRCRMPRGVAVEELLLHIRFPAEVSVPKRLNVRVGLGPAQPLRWSSLSAGTIVKIESQRAVQARIAHPLADAVYEINWNLDPDVRPPTGSSRDRAVALALHLRERFGGNRGGRWPDALQGLLERIELLARDELGAGAAQQTRAYDISLFGFETATHCLHYLVGSHPLDDARRGGAYAFGLGTVGRAFKSGEVAAFRRPVQSPRDHPWGYMLPDGQPVTDRGQVPEVAILAFPLAPPEAKDWPFAVLQISTDDPSCVLKTTNTPSDVSVERFAAAVAALTPDLDAILH